MSLIKEGKIVSNDIPPDPNDYLSSSLQDDGDDDYGNQLLMSKSDKAPVDQLNSMMPPGSYSSQDLLDIIRSTSAPSKSQALPKAVPLPKKDDIYSQIQEDTKSISPTPTPTSPAPAQPPEDDSLSEDEQKASSSFSERRGKIIIAVGILAVILLVVILKSCASAPAKKIKTEEVPIVTQSGVEVVQGKAEGTDEPKKDEIDAVTETVWGSRSDLNYVEYVDMPSRYFTDEMLVTKFVLEDESSALFYFSGIPKHFKRKITFPVTVTEYNKIPSGGKIFIDYRIYSKGGNDLITDVHTSLED